MKQTVAQKFPQEYNPQTRVLKRELRGKDFINGMADFKYDHRFIYLQDIVYHPRQHKLYYYLLNFEEYVTAELVLTVGEGMLIPSLKVLWDSAKWLEAKLQDFYLLKFDLKALALFGHQKDLPFPRALKHFNDPRLGEKDFTLSPSWRVEQGGSLHHWQEHFVSPMYPLEEDFHLWLQFSGETIERLKFELGFNFQGVEEQVERSPVSQWLSHMSALRPENPLVLQLLLAHSFEEQHRVQLSDRDQALRMLLLEMSRIESHLQTLARQLYFIQLNQPAQLLRKARWSLLLKLQEYWQTPQLDQLISWGGLKKDLSDRHTLGLMKFVEELKEGLSSIFSDLAGNSLIFHKLRTNRISSEFAIDWSFSGPALRSAGINIDFRKHRPFYFYSEVDFEVPLGGQGSCFDRFLIYQEEIEQSFRLISQLLMNMPRGSDSPPQRWTPPEDAEVGFFTFEGPQGIYSLTKCAQGSRSFFQLQTPSFHHFQAMEELGVGKTWENLHTLLNSLHIRLLEVDK